MTQPSASLTVAIFDRLVCVKIIGRANFTSSLDFKRVINELFDRSYRHFILDLSECVLMDSTFLGTLAGVGLKFANERIGPEGIELWNPNARLRDLLENLGVAHLFKITTDTRPVAGEFAPMDNDKEPSRLEMTRNCLEAHELLMKVNPDNVRKFKDVAQFLAEDVRKLEHAQEKVAH